LAALDCWKLFKAIGYERTIESPHYGARDYPVPEVRAFHNSDARIKICSAPARSGKSWSSAHDLIPDILEPLVTGRPPQERRHLIVGPEYEHASKEFGYLLDVLVHQKERLGIPGPTNWSFHPKLGRLEIYWKEFNTRLIGKSAKQIQSLLGDQYITAILSETAQMQDRVWLQGLSTRVARSIWPTTPSVQGRWIREFFYAAQARGDSQVQHFRFPPWANPYYDKTRFDEELERRGADDPFFREQFLGDWDVFYGGRVFPQFQHDPVEEVGNRITPEGIQGGDGCHCIAPFDIPAGWKRLGGMDFGWNDATVLLFAAVSPDGTVIIYDEYYAQKRSMGEHVSLIEAQAAQNGTPWPVTVFHERKGQGRQIAMDMTIDHGIATVDSDPDRIAGRLRVQEYLDKGTSGMPRLRIVRDSCPNLVKELLELHYDRQGVHREGAAEKWLGSDHAVDALRYLLMSRPVPHRLPRVLTGKVTLDQLLAQHKRRVRRLGMIGHLSSEGYRYG
jgi:hypothetical protein